MLFKKSGFTLIELLIVVAIIGLLSLIAWPSYQDYVKKGKRAEGKSALAQAAQAMERYFTNNNTYTVDLAEAGFRAYSGESAATSGYTLTAIAGTTQTIATSFILTAVPSNWDDTTGCGNLTINHSGTRGVSGGAYTSAQCW